MAGSGDHIKALVRSHASGDEDSFYAIAAQIAAQEARKGHNRLARDLKQAIDSARQAPLATRPTPVTPIAQPRGDLAELVTASFPRVGLSDLIAPSELLDRIEEVLVEQRQRKVLAQQGFTPAHKLLLEGPPGTGKTLTARVIAHELSLPLLAIRMDSVMSKFLGETASKLRVVFDAANEQRAVYLFDEFDALGGDRGTNDVGEARRIVSSFLVFLEQLGPESVVIAATNHRTILDRALFRRFDAVIRYELPDSNQAIEVMKMRLGPLGRNLKWSKIGEQVGGMSHADLVKAAEAAGKQAVMRGDAKVRTADLIDAIEIRRGGQGD